MYPTAVRGFKVECLPEKIKLWDTSHCWEAGTNLNNTDNKNSPSVTKALSINVC